MLALGLKDSQIGLILSIGLSVQIFRSLFSGPITDKLGRRMTTFIFDMIAWSDPNPDLGHRAGFPLLSCSGLFNGTWRVTHTSWSCLLVEDANPDHLVDIYSWIYIAGLLVCLLCPDRRAAG